MYYVCIHTCGLHATELVGFTSATWVGGHQDMVDSWNPVGEETPNPLAKVVTNGHDVSRHLIHVQIVQ